MIKVSQEIKGLKTQLEKIDGRLTVLRQESDSIQNERNSLRRRKKRTLQKIKELEANITEFPIITEHAALQYCVRVLGISIEDIEKAILSDMFKNAYSVLKSNGEYPFKTEYVAVVKNNKIVTVK